MTLMGFELTLLVMKVRMALIRNVISIPVSLKSPQQSIKDTAGTAQIEDITITTFMTFGWTRLS